MSKATFRIIFSYFFVIFFNFFLLNTSIFADAAPWQGSYIGTYIGGAFGNNQTSANTGAITSNAYFTTEAAGNAVAASASSTNYPDALIGGIQAGHDWAWRKIVFGVVLDYGSFSLDGSSNQNNIAYPSSTDTYSVNTSLSTNWLLTLRARLGYPLQFRCPTLLYTTGGMAITELKIHDQFSDNTSLLGAGSMQNNLYDLGWTAGFGVEVAALKKLSVNLEYLYIYMPSATSSGTISNSAPGFGVPSGSLISPWTMNNLLHANLLKLALNYRFNE